MDPAGLAVGLIGLAGLFNTCMDVVQRCSSYKHFAQDSHSLNTRFEAQKLRLEKWGQAVGLDNRTLADSRHEAAHDPRTVSVIKEILGLIHQCCDSPDISAPLQASPSCSLNSPPSRGQKIGWALKTKTKRIAQVTQFRELVQTLHDLVPPDGSEGNTEAATAALDDNGSVSSDIQRILEKIERDIEAERSRDLQAWIMGRNNPNEVYDRSINDRLDGTCDWLLARADFKNWLSSEFNNKPKVLWINGPAGFGKTVLCANVVHHLSSKADICTASFFMSSEFYSRDDPFIAIRSWISQIIPSHPVACAITQKLREEQNEHSVSRGTLMEIFRQVVEAVPGCTLVMDGIDECTWMRESRSPDAYESIPGFLKAVRKALEKTESRLLIVSRDEQDVRYGLGGLAGESHDDVVEYSITPEDLKRDLELYSKSIVNERLRTNHNEKVKIEISEELVNRCNGMFLWLKLQESQLRSWKNKKQLHDAIEKTPSGLDGLFSRNWERIVRLPEDEQKRATRLLRWAAFSLRPLTVCEITEAMLVGDGEMDLELDDMPDMIDDEYIQTEILGRCASLVVVRPVATGKQDTPGQRTVHLPHFSVREFLLCNLPAQSDILVSNGRQQFSTESLQATALARLCLRYVQLPGVWAEDSEPNPDDPKRSFRDYAAGSWFQHLVRCRRGELDLIDLLKTLFDSRSPVWTFWSAWFRYHDHQYQYSRETLQHDSSDGPLFYAALLGLTETAKFLIHERKECVTAKGSWGETALHFACSHGCSGIAELLLDNGADINVPTEMGITALMYAIWGQHLEVSRLLLRRGADVTTTDTADRRGVMHYASVWGHVEILQACLNLGADIEAADGNGWTPLVLAASRAPSDSIEFLLQQGANASPPGDEVDAPIHFAAARGDARIVQLLLDKGANVDARSLDDGKQATPLMIASEKSSVELVQLLLDRRADVNAANNKGQTPLFAACSAGATQNVEMLLKNGADPAIRTEGGYAPLAIATTQGHAESVALLIKHGANVNEVFREGRTAAALAASHGRADMVRLLLENGADSALADIHGTTPLHLACLGSDVETVKVLIDHPSPAARWGLTVMHMAAMKGNVDIVQVLLSHEAVPDPLSTASRETDLWQATDANKPDNAGRTPLSAACLMGNANVVRTLCGHPGIDPNSTDCNGTTPLSVAARLGDKDAVDILLGLDTVDIDLRDSFGRSPLWWAFWTGRVATTEVLLDALVARGVFLDPSQMPQKGYTELRDSNVPACSVCLLYFPVDEVCFRCDVCDYSKRWDICSRCQAAGAHCLDARHKLRHCNLSIVSQMEDTAASELKLDSDAESDDEWVTASESASDCERCETASEV